jgi:hypothetical protein
MNVPLYFCYGSRVYGNSIFYLYGGSKKLYVIDWKTPVRVMYQQRKKQKKRQMRNWIKMELSNNNVLLVPNVSSEKMTQYIGPVYVSIW